jgi:hypothetical protein
MPSAGRACRRIWVFARRSTQEENPYAEGRRRPAATARSALSSGGGAELVAGDAKEEEEGEESVGSLVSNASSIHCTYICLVFAGTC